MKTASPIFVSVLIPVFNAQDYLDRCLTAILAQDYPSDSFEVIAIDNCSQDQSVQIAQNYPIKLLSCSIKGPAATRNVGISQARGDIVLFIDADCVAHTQLIRHHVYAHIKFQDQASNIGLVAGSIVGINQNYWARCDDFCSWVDQHPNVAAGIVNQAPTANLSIRRELLTIIRGFDEDRRFGEDIAFCQKAKTLGYSIYFEPLASLGHINRTSLKGFLSHGADWISAMAQKKETESNPYLGKGLLRFWLLNVYIALKMIAQLTLKSFRSHRANVLLYLPFIALNIFNIRKIEYELELNYRKKLNH